MSEAGIAGIVAFIKRVVCAEIGCVFEPFIPALEGTVKAKHALEYPHGTALRKGNDHRRGQHGAGNGITAPHKVQRGNASSH